MIYRNATFLVVIQWAISMQAFAQQPPATIEPGEQLFTENIPPIPVSLADEVRRYTESRAASFQDGHPTKRELLISTRFANTAQIHHVATPGGARTQLTFFAEPVAEATYDPVAGRYFLFTKDTGGDEFAQIYRYDFADGRVTLLTDGKRSQNGRVEWSRKGDRVVYASTGRNGADRDLWLIDPMDPKSNRLLAELSGGGWFPCDWSSDDRKILTLEYFSANRSTLWEVDAATGEKTRLTPESGEPVSWGGGQYAADGRGIYVTTDQESEFQRLVYFDLATKRVTPLTSDIPWDVEWFELSPNGKTLAFLMNEAGVSKLYLMDTKSRELKLQTGIPVGVVTGLKWRRNNAEVAFALDSARSALDVYSLNVSSGEVTRWTESELGGLVPQELAEPELIRWKSFDDREITGFYYRPPARFTGKRPVIIDIHGGPEGQTRPGFLGRENYFLNELGTAIIFPNVRGSKGYGKTYLKLDNGNQREDSVRDIGALLDWIAEQPDLDASRVMVTGGSYGGYMTLAVATNYADRIRCALDVVGISHFGTFLKNTESYRRDLRRYEYGDERDPEMAAFFDRISPLNNAQRITKPLFVVQGGNDPRVPLSEAEQIVARVKQEGTPVWYLMARDEGHGFRKKNNQDYQFYATVLFMREFLLDKSPE
ncbi:MAG: S9 family peptidase [Pirellulales bacterium]